MFILAFRISCPKMFHEYINTSYTQYLNMNRSYEKIQYKDDDFRFYRELFIAMYDDK